MEMITPESGSTIPHALRDTPGAPPASRSRARRTYRDLHRKMLADFERRCRTDVRMLQKAFDCEDLCTLMEVAYGIAGASRTAGEMRLASACDAIEHAGRMHFALIDAGVATAEPLGAPAREAYRFFQRELASLRFDLYLDRT